MGKVLSIVLRPIKTFNIENRAHRVIGKEKPVAAPRYPSNILDVQRALEAEPDLIEKLSKKNSDLDNRLRDVFVTSEGSNEDVFLKQRHNPKRPLPQNKHAVPDFDYGLKEPETIPYGKTTLRHVLQFLSDNQVNAKDFTVPRIAVDYKMKEEDVSNIIKYFKTFDIYVPATKKMPAQYAGPSKVRQQIEAQRRLLENDGRDDQIEQKPDAKKNA